MDEHGHSIAYLETNLFTPVHVPDFRGFCLLHPENSVNLLCVTGPWSLELVLLQECSSVTEARKSKISSKRGILDWTMWQEQVASSRAESETLANQANIISNIPLYYKIASGTHSWRTKISNWHFNVTFVMSELSFSSFLSKLLKFLSVNFCISLSVLTHCPWRSKSLQTFIPSSSKLIQTADFTDWICFLPSGGSIIKELP